MLTRKQHELLTFIDHHLKTTGFSPSFEEMKEALNLKSKSGIHRLISALEERGFLQRRHHRARALEVVRLPDDIAASRRRGTPPSARKPISPPMSSAAISPPASPASASPTRPPPSNSHVWPHRRRHADRGDARHRRPHRSAHGADRPGRPLRPRSRRRFDDRSRHLDGDTVIIRRGETADNGQIVVALVDDNEVTLKRLRRRGNSIALEPANQTTKPRFSPPTGLKSRAAWSPFFANIERKQALLFEKRSKNFHLLRRLTPTSFPLPLVGRGQGWGAVPHRRS